MNQIVRFRGKTGSAWRAGRAQGQAEGLLDAADNMDTFASDMEQIDVVTRSAHLSAIATGFRVRADELKAEVQAIVDEATRPAWWRRALSALRPRW